MRADSSKNTSACQRERGARHSRPMSRMPSPTIGPRIAHTPEGDDRERMLCPDCGFIQYDNPKVVVGAVVHWQDRLMLCRRNINPRKGYWTLPAGYMELNETVQEGAMREAWE